MSLFLISDNFGRSILWIKRASLLNWRGLLINQRKLQKTSFKLERGFKYQQCDCFKGRISNQQGSMGKKALGNSIQPFIFRRNLENFSTNSSGKRKTRALNGLLHDLSEFSCRFLVLTDL